MNRYKAICTLFFITLLSQQGVASVCTECFHEKVSLWMQCLANPKLYRYAPNWCRTIGLQADKLSNVASFCDKQLRFDKSNFKLSDNINVAILSHYMKEEKTLPYNVCDACIYNTSVLYALYFAQRCAFVEERINDKRYKKSFCEKLQYCAKNIASVFSLHPYVLAEPLK